MHPFEKSRLGKPPYRFITVICLPPRSLLETNVGAYNHAIRRASADAKSFGVCIGTCYHCGMALMNNFVVKSSEGNHFVVGCDCVMKSGWADPSLAKDIKQANKDRIKRSRLAKKIAIVKKSLREKRKEFFEVHRDTLLLAWNSRRKSTFLRDLCFKFLRYGKLSDLQIKAIPSAIERIKEMFDANSAEASRKAKATFVGKAGERIERHITLIFSLKIETSFGPANLSIFRDSEGNTLKAIGVCPIKKGETRKVKFTIKGHHMYKDEKQTTINRLKIAD